MIKLFFLIGCIIFFPHCALAAGQVSLSAPSPLCLLILFLLLLIVVCLLWVSLQKSKSARKEIFDQLQLAQQTLDEAPWDILWVDAERKIVRTNQSALRLAGSERQLIGCDLLELQPELRNHPFIAALQTGKEAAADVPSVSRTQEAFGCSVTKKVAQVAIRGKRLVVCYGDSPTHDADQTTDTAQRDAANRKAFQLVESASRMKSEYLANINHEIRTPMNAIIGYSEMLAAADLGLREKRFVSIIHKSCMTLVSIFNDIMELSRIDSGRLHITPSAIRLDGVINEVEELFQVAADEKELRFQCQIEPDLPLSFILDGVRLKQILQHLVNNAITFTHHGAVALSVSGMPSKEQSDWYDLCFRVQDSGVGITVCDQQKLFELFQQRENSVSPQYGKVGLGLTLCSRLIAMMGGTINFSSSENEGSVFTVVFNDVRVAEQVPEKPSAQKIPCGDKQSKKLLVVDDMELIKEIFVDFFKGTPFEIVTAHNGEEALRVAVAEKPDLIFMDLNLAGMDGRAVTERLHRQPETATIPVVVMTGDLLEENDYKPLFDEFLQKPFRLDVLQNIVNRCMQSCRHAAQTTPTDTRNNGEHTFTAGIAGVWTEELEQLHRQALGSGSLSDAASLGAAIREAGIHTNQLEVAQLGEELLLYTGEPDIVGVERLLVKLSRAVHRKLS